MDGRELLQKSNELEMLKALKKLLGFGPAVNYSDLMKQGAVILDVRTKGEFANGHIPGSINISVDTLVGNLNKLKAKDKPIITCCASGMRSASATSILKSKAYTNVHNGGAWNALQHKIK